MLGYNTQEFGTDIYAFESRLHEDDVSIVKECVQQYIQNELSEYVISFRMYHKDGRIVWIDARAKAIRDNEGHAKRIIGTHRDITDQKNVEEHLKEDM